MKTVFKKALAAAVSGMMLLGMTGALPVIHVQMGAKPIVACAAGASIQDEMNKFPQGKYWNHVGGSNNPDGWTNSPCTHHGNCDYYPNACDCNSFRNGIQCFAFASKVADDIYGQNPYNWSKDKIVSNLKAGDVLRIYGDEGGLSFGNNGHSIIIVSVDGNSVRYGDCNFGNNHCKIIWDHYTTKQQLQNDMSGAGDGVFHAPYEAPFTSIPEGHVMTEEEAAGQTIPDGEYYIVSELDRGYYLDIPGNDYNTKNGNQVCMWNWGETNTSKEYDVFRLEYQTDGVGKRFYRLYQRTTNQCLDVSGADLHAGKNINMWESHDSYGQFWSIERTNHGYRLRSKANGFCLDVVDGIVENGHELQTYPLNDSAAQSFSFIPYQPKELVEDGIYKISFRENTGWYLDASGDGNYENGSNIQIWEKTGDLFRISKAGDGYYRISELSSGMMLDADCNNFMKVLRNVTIYQKNNYRQQFWAFRSAGNGQFFIINKLNGYYLDLDSGKRENGHNINVYPWAYPDANNQKWSLEPVSLTGLSVKQLPNKTVYYVGDEIKPDGIEVSAEFGENASTTVTNAVKYSYDFSSTGEKTVTVSYTLDGITVSAAFPVTVRKIEFKGSGTESDPYLIENKKDLELMRDLINDEDYSPSFRSCSYLQTVDIDLSDEQWTPIGKSWFDGKQTDRFFGGHYDGGNHWITGLNVNETTKFAGLFGSVSGGACIENLAVSGKVVSAELSAGGIIGELSGGNCKIQNCCFIGDISGKKAANGGIVGYIWQNGTVRNCYHIGQVTSENERSVGGIVGRIQANEIENAVCTVENCYHVGAMQSGQPNAGTIIGFIDKGDNDKNATVKLENCYALAADGAAIGGNVAGDVQDISVVKENLLRKAASELGDAYIENTDLSLFGGYPVFPWQLRLSGDINADGRVDIADAVLLSKWLTAVPDTALPDWEAGDLNGDGKLTAVDLTLLKRILLLSE